jgi:hypothetical protein
MKLDAQFNIKIASSDRQLVEAAAGQRDQSPAEFARTVLLNVARATLAATDSPCRAEETQSE